MFRRIDNFVTTTYQQNYELKLSQVFTLPLGLDAVKTFVIINWHPNLCVIYGEVMKLLTLKTCWRGGVQSELTA